jgi:hypothetical protein
MLKKTQKQQAFKSLPNFIIAPYALTKVFVKAVDKESERFGYLRPRRKTEFSLVHKTNPLTPNDLQRRRAVSPLKIKIPSKNMSEKLTNTPIIHSVY